MIGVGGLIGDAHGKKGNDGSEKVEAGMHRLRQNAQAAGARYQKNLERQQQHGGADGRQRGEAFFARGLLGWIRSHAPDYTMGMRLLRQGRSIDQRQTARFAVEPADLHFIEQ